jgi:hypothetical protein
MSEDHTIGIANPDKPGRWLVPPWRTGASFSHVVRHFLRFHPWYNPNTAHLLAYFEGYQAALESAPVSELTNTFQHRWCADMLECVARCVTLYREKCAAEIHQAKANVSTSQTVI